MQHSLVVAYIDKKKLNKVVKKETAVRRKVRKFKDGKMRTKFEERVGELMSTGTQNAQNL